MYTFSNIHHKTLNDFRITLAYIWWHCQRLKTFPSLKNEPQFRYYFFKKVFFLVLLEPALPTPLSNFLFTLLKVYLSLNWRSLTILDSICRNYSPWAFFPLKIGKPNKMKTRVWKEKTKTKPWNVKGINSGEDHFSKLPNRAPLAMNQWIRIITSHFPNNQ